MFLASFTNRALQNGLVDDSKSLRRKLAFRTELAENTKLAKTKSVKSVKSVAVFSL